MEKKPSDTKIIFMGTSDFAGVILDALIVKKYNIVSVYTQTEKRIGKKREPQNSSVRMLAEKFNLSVIDPEYFNEKAIGEISAQNPDIIVVAAYGKILPKKVLDIPKFGAINVHPSLLPRFRGPSPIQNALLAGEKETGTTIMLMDEGIDTGNILDQKKIDIEPDATYPIMLSMLAELSAELLLRTIALWMAKKIIPKKQDNFKATACQLIERQDGRIIWTDDAEAIYNRWRAFIPWPGVFTFWEKENSNIRIKLNKIAFLADNAETSKFHIGEVFRWEEIIAVKTTNGSIVLKEVQLEGKNNMKIGDFTNGYPNFIGSLLK